MRDECIASRPGARTARRASPSLARRKLRSSGPTGGKLDSADRPLHTVAVTGPTPVVYVEDNQANLLLVRRVLESTGKYRVVGVTDGTTALAVISDVMPAIVLLDLDLPGTSGLQVAKSLRQDPKTAQIPILVVTASVMRQERQEAQAVGCQGFLEKPFDIHVLRQEVDALIAASRGA